MVGRVLRCLAHVLALTGGAIVLALVVMSLVSLVGRKLFSAPVPGDIEMLEMAIAVAVTAFLPLCELNGNHIRVDILAGILPDGVNRVLLSVGHVLLAAVAALVAWRTVLLVDNSLTYGSTSTMLAAPLWIPQSLMVPSLLMLTLCALYRAGRSLVEPAIAATDADDALREAES